MRGGGWAVVGTADQPTVGQEELLEEAIGHAFWPRINPSSAGTPSVRSAGCPDEFGDYVRLIRSTIGFFRAK